MDQHRSEKGRRMSGQMEADLLVGRQRERERDGGREERKEKEGEEERRRKQAAAGNEMPHHILVGDE